MQEVEGEEDGEDAVAVVDGVGIDAVDAEEDEGRGEKGGEEPGAIGGPIQRQIRRFWLRQIDDLFWVDDSYSMSGAFLVQESEEDAPGEEGCGAGFQCGAENVGVVDAAEDADDGGVEKKDKRRVGEGEVAVGELAEADAEAAVEEIADVPEGGDAGVLPEGEGGSREEECGGGEGVAESACRGCVHARIRRRERLRGQGRW